MKRSYTLDQGTSTSSKLRSATASLVLLPVSLVVVFCFGFELVNFKRTNNEPLASSSHGTTRNQAATPIQQPLAELTAKPLEPIQSVVATTPTAASVADVASNQSTGAGTVLQPSTTTSTSAAKTATPQGATSPKNSTLSAPVVQQLLSQKLIISLPKQ